MQEIKKEKDELIVENNKIKIQQAGLIKNNDFPNKRIELNEIELKLNKLLQDSMTSTAAIKQYEELNTLLREALLGTPITKDNYKDLASIIKKNRILEARINGQINVKDVSDIRKCLDSFKNCLNLIKSQDPKILSIKAKLSNLDDVFGKNLVTLYQAIGKECTEYANLIKIKRSFNPVATFSKALNKYNGEKNHVPHVHKEMDILITQMQNNKIKIYKENIVSKISSLKFKR